MNLKRRHLLALAPLLAAADPVRALMAGSAPDTPQARIDANLPSSHWTSAVAVLTKAGIFSGVVVAPRYVLTAAHVAAAALPADVVVQLNHESVPLQVTASAIATFPGAYFPYDDLSLITLASPVPEGVEILPIRRELPAVHQELTLVGYGGSGTGDQGVSVLRAAGVKRSGRNALDAVQPSIDNSGRRSLFFLYDFDGPSGAGTLGGPTLGNAVETSVAGGDSGGPAYAEVDGRRWLVGINTVSFAASAGVPVDFRFGTIGGGMLLCNPRFIAWLEAQTGGTLGPAPVAEVPLPAWALGIGAAGLLGALGFGWRRRTS